MDSCEATVSGPFSGSPHLWSSGVGGRGPGEGSHCTLVVALDSLETASCKGIKGEEGIIVRRKGLFQ